MAVQQIDSSFQNDGNFAQLDLQDVAAKGPHFRIETFRCSQPRGGFGVTKAGSLVEVICGSDHLTADSNKIFRSVDSVDRGPKQVVILEIRESIEFSGSCHVRVRDLDVQSPSYGHVIVATITPVPGNRYRLDYEVRVPAPGKAPVEIVSPLTTPIANAAGLADIGDDIKALGTVDNSLPGNPMSGDHPLEWAEI